MLTTKTVDRAIREAPSSGKKSITLTDDGDRGAGRLLLIVRPMTRGVVSQWYAASFRGRTRKMIKIGTYPAMGVAEARLKFEQQFKPAISTGRTPRVGRRGAKGGTVSALFAEYVDHLEQSGKRSAKLVKGYLDKAAEVIGLNLPACEVTDDDVLPFLSAMYGRGAKTSATSARAYLAAAFRWGQQQEKSMERVSAVRWAIKVNPVDFIPRPKNASKPGDRFLEPAELRQFWKWLDGYTEESGAAFAMMVTLATGQRVEEILKISSRRGEGLGYYDSDARTVEWGKTKSDFPHVLPLPRQAVEVLDRKVPNAHERYFWHQYHGEGVMTHGAVFRVVERFLEDHTGFRPFSPRDARRTWKTLSGRAGLGKEIRDRLQNHRSRDVSSVHYDRFDYLEEKRAGMLVWEGYLDKVLAGEIETTGGKVVVMSRAGEAA